MAKYAESNNWDKAIHEMLESAQPQQELRLGQLACFTKRGHPISERMVEGARQGDFKAFDGVMAALVRDGMQPVSREDMGVFTSWLIINFPYNPASGANPAHEMDERHDDVTNKLGCWDFAASRECSQDDKVRFARLLRRYFDERLTDNAGPSPSKTKELAIEAFGQDDVGIVRRILRQPLPPDYLVFQENSSRILLTEEGLAEARRQGWYREPGGLRPVGVDLERCYTYHRGNRMRITMKNVAALIDMEL